MEVRTDNDGGVLYLEIATVFIMCEYILTWDEVYPLSVSMATGVVGALTFWRCDYHAHLHVHTLIT